MRTDVLEHYDFYKSPLGAMARGFITARLGEAWGDARGLRVAGFGYANPYLKLFTAAERRISMAPDGQGVIRWPSGARENCACLVREARWPLPDASLDRILIVHGLEETPVPQKLLREVWRVLSDDGRVIIVVSHRRGLWSIFGATPFSAGRPFTRRQLNDLLAQSLFRPEHSSASLFFPPVNARFLLRAAGNWERAGARVCPGLGGVLLV